MTNRRSLFYVFRATKRLVAACAFATAIAAVAVGQTPTNKLESTGNAGVGTTTPAYPLTVLGAPSADPFVQGYFKSTSTSFPYGGVAVDGDSQSHVRFMLGGTLKWQWRVGAGSAVDDLRAYNWTLGADVVTLKNNGNVGIGTTSPSDLLEVNSTIGWGFRVRYAGDGQYLRVSANQLSAYTAAGTPKDLYLNTDGGKVGIGTTTPSYKLDVNGEINATGIRINGTPISSGGSSPWLGTGSIYYNGGNVGIGTPTPANRFEVVEANSATGSSIRVLTGSASAYGGYAIGRTGTEGYWGVAGGAGHYSTGTVAGDVVLRAESNLILGNGDNATVYLKSNGNVGVGTTSPNSKLDVNGNLSVAGSGTNDTVKVLSTSSVSGGAFIQNNQAGAQAVMYFENNRGSYASYGGLIYGGSNTALSNLFGLNRSDKMFLFADGASNQGLAVGTLAAQPLIFGTSNAERMRIDSSGKVGIGKSDPTVALDVQGDIKASGTIFAKYQDLAEWVPSSEQLSAGTVVVLDTTKSNQVVSATVAYDTRVAGVISAQPGISLGEGGEGKVLVATTGRVRVKVDASRGPIQIGDLLVTSDVSGVAMKSEPVEFAGRKMHMPGTIIGKALEPLAKGSGEILVLLSLQ